MQIKTEHYQQLMRLNDKKIALEQFIRTITAEGQRMMGELHTETRDIWGEISKEHKLNLQYEEWAPSKKPNEIVCLQRRYLPSDT